MAISNKTRKLLWGRSANRCTYCQFELSMDASGKDAETILGEECHIKSARPKGPRFDPTLGPSEIDSYNNLILLCRNHHRVIDDRPNEYSSSSLRRLKERHEKWVRQNLAKVQSKKSGRSKELPRITSGRELIAFTSSAELFEFDHDDLKTEDEVEMVGHFLQEMQDWGDMSDLMEAKQRVSATLEYTELLQRLETHGFMVFGAREIRKYKTGELIGNWSVAVLRVLRSNNPAIQSAPRGK